MTRQSPEGLFIGYWLYLCSGNWSLKQPVAIIFIAQIPLLWKPFRNAFRWIGRDKANLFYFCIRHPNIFCSQIPSMSAILRVPKYLWLPLARLAKSSIAHWNMKFFKWTWPFNGCCYTWQYHNNTVLIAIYQAYLEFLNIWALSNDFWHFSMSRHHFWILARIL